MPQPLRVLVCIPHYYRRDRSVEQTAYAQNGSVTDSIEARAEVFRYCLAHLGSQLRTARFRIGSSGETFDPNGFEIGMDLVELAPPAVVGDIRIQATPDNHILDQVLENYQARFAEAYLSNINPRMLGYQCRHSFAQRVGDYDLFCYIEDDTAILDPRFFLKVQAFYDRFGEDKVLMPNRYELTGVSDNTFRSYLDGPMMRFHRIEVNRDGPDELVAETFEGRIRFERSETVMSGAYVLTRNQLRRWMDQPDFALPPPELLARPYDPLEIAQIPMLASLPFYRPAMENLDFLEVHHVPNRASNARTPRAAMAKLLHGMGYRLRGE